MASLPCLSQNLNLLMVKTTIKKIISDKINIADFLFAVSKPLRFSCLLCLSGKFFFYSVYAINEQQKKRDLKKNRADCIQIKKYRSESVFVWFSFVQVFHNDHFSIFKFYVDFFVVFQTVENAFVGM